jgi:inositol-pentakisphosphate 2-kinase
MSRYCPLDLFSAEPGRMTAALRALLDAPQNNLTVRRDGELVFGGAGQFGKAPKVRVGAPLAPRATPDAPTRPGQDDLAPLCAALDGFACDGMPGESRLDLLVRVLVLALQSHGVLHRLRAVQHLDEYDVEGAFQARCCSEQSLLCWPSSSHLLSRAVSHTALRAALQAYCAVMGEEHAAELPGREQHAGAEASTQSARAVLRALPRDRALAVLRDFMVAQTAKDCAIMVALQQLPADAEHCAADEIVLHDAVTGLRFRSKASFLDLDIKRVASMRRYLDLDREVVAHYLRSFAQQPLDAVQPPLDAGA